MLEIYRCMSLTIYIFFFFNDTATTEIYTLSLHDALPISREPQRLDGTQRGRRTAHRGNLQGPSGSADRPTHQSGAPARSEEHTSELQSLAYLVCRLLLEKKKQKVRGVQIIVHNHITHNSL